MTTYVCICIRKDFSNMMPFEQIPKGGKKVSHISFLGGGLFRQKKQMVQRSCRGTRSPYSRKSKDPIVAKAG